MSVDISNTFSSPPISVFVSAAINVLFSTTSRRFAERERNVPIIVPNKNVVRTIIVIGITH